jgi:hypothetical protein
VLHAGKLLWLYRFAFSEAPSMSARLENAPEHDASGRLQLVLQKLLNPGQEIRSGVST